MRSPFGGWTAALCVRACLQAGARGELVAFSLDFLAAIPDGPVEVSLMLDRRSASLDFWSGTVMAGGQRCSRFMATFGRVRTGPDFTEAEMPVVTPWRDIQLFAGREGAPAFFGAYETRWVAGHPMRPNPTTRSLTWARDADARPLDAPGIVAMADLPLPRVFLRPGRPGIIATVSLTVHPTAGADEMRAVGGEPVLLEAQARRARAGFIDQWVRIWSPDGRLLATSEQVVWIRMAEEA